MFSPALIVSGASPCAARALLITASTWLAGSDAEDVLLVDDVAGALEAAELCDEVEPAADCEGGFMVLFEVLVVGLAESGRVEGGAEELDPVEELKESDGAGVVAAAEEEVPSAELSDVVGPPAWVSDLGSVMPVVTTTAPMTAPVAASATAALAAKCDAADRAPDLGIRRCEWAPGLGPPNCTNGSAGPEGIADPIGPPGPPGPIGPAGPPGPRCPKAGI